MTNKRGVKHWIHGTVYWKNNTDRNQTKKVSQQKPENSFLYFLILFFLDRGDKVRVSDFLVNN